MKKQLQSVIDWISVDDELPKTFEIKNSYDNSIETQSDDLLVCFENGSVQYGIMYTDSHGCTEWGQSENGFEYWNKFYKKPIFWAIIPTVNL